MDFHSIINAAKQNVAGPNDRSSNYYKTKFDAPKKTTKEKKLSSGIRKFLEKQKIEEEEKIREAREKKLELMARRDPKEQRKIEKTLKVIKSSKKFYTGDKELDENTEITLEKSIGDDDDYGFENKSSEAIYLKLMEQYKKMPTEDKFEKFMNPKKSKSNANNQVANNQEEGDEYHIKTGHRQRVSKIKGEGSSQLSASKKSAFAPPAQSSSTTPTKSSSSSKSKVKYEKYESPKSAPPADKSKPKLRAAPIVDFNQLLKLAEQKQHEDIIIDMPTKKEPERLLTMKEKRELEELEAARKGKLKGNGAMNKIPKLGAIPRLNDPSKQDRNNNSDKTPQKLPSNDKRLEKSDSKVPVSKSSKPISSKSSASPPSSGSKLRDALIKKDERSSNSSPISSKVQQKQQVPQSSSKPQVNGSGMKQKGIMPSSSKMPPPMPKSGSSSTMNGKVDKSRLPHRRNHKSRDFPPKDLMRSREFPPRDLMRTREFPPKDVRRFKEPPRGMKMPVKRRIEDEDSDSEYDSEMDDFIDDDDVCDDYSSEIQKIFGYDKSRYRDEDFDDREMESDYRTVMREEFISKKLGLQEDLEDMRMEAEEIKRKQMMKKKRRKIRIKKVIYELF
ncbi:LOW QUALITY PROTEIN: protein SPT2 homolog [Chironomus tepperi]|uniref:LOW QUALITY PROTEIN: protein SPT2 homolog n=1 Tax=Chironomus tepperi TaxID=113505 RepID=UPI00391F44CB